MGKVPSLEAAGGMQGGLFDEKPKTQLCPHPAPIHPQPHNRVQPRD